MDNDVFRKTYREINERFCPYEGSILINKCRCSLSQRFTIAERQGVNCKSEEAQKQCIDLLEILRHQSRFTLKSGNDHTVLPHAKAMRVQVGGLRGIFTVLHPDQTAPPIINDIYALVEAARTQFDGFDNLPFQVVIKQIAAYQGQPRFRSDR